MVAHFDPVSLDNNRVTGGLIVVFTRRSDGSSCEPFDKTIAHELGHVLGFDDSGCHDSRIMGARVAQGDYREVKPDECAGAASRWTTSSENGGGGPGVENPDECAGNPFCLCPLILDLNGDGVRTTDASAPVDFDLNADGIAERITWTDPRTEEAFLWIDVVPNGVVDNGSELFGIGMMLPSGRRAANGFAALGAYDDPAQGGNGDGRITVSDAIWSRLRLWVDANHDGRSQPQELGPIQRYGVVELRLDYAFDGEADAAGNNHLFRGTYLRRMHGGLSEEYALDDVFFLPVL